MTLAQLLALTDQHHRATSATAGQTPHTDTGPGLLALAAM